MLSAASVLDAIEMAAQLVGVNPILDVVAKASDDNGLKHFCDDWGWGGCKSGL